MSVIESEYVPGTGLLFHEGAKGEMDKYFEFPDNPAPLHSNIYIEADETGVATLNCKYIDKIDDLFLIFDKENGDDKLPFEEVSLILPDGTVIWRITSNCLTMLEEANAIKKRTDDLPQTIIRLPLWLSKAYDSHLAVPERFRKARQIPLITHGMNIGCHVKSHCIKGYTLGAHVIIMSNENRKIAFSLPREVPVDIWEEDHHVLDVKNEVDNFLTMKFPSKAKLVLTDILFAAFDINGKYIPIKYLRAFHGPNEILSINTSQLQYTSKLSPVYLYSHLPGKLCLSRLNLSWQIDFITPQSYASAYVYPRTWNILMFADKTAGLKFSHT